MIDWCESDYVGGSKMFSAMVEDVAVSIVPSLTTPVEWRLETSIPGVSSLLGGVVSDDKSEVLVAGVSPSQKNGQ